MTLYHSGKDKFIGYIVDRNGNQMNYIGGGPPDGRGLSKNLDFIILYDTFYSLRPLEGFVL